MRKLIFVISLVLFTAITAEVQAISLGDSRSFNVDSSYDATNREHITAELKEITRYAYFYCDKDWWDDLDYEQRTKVGKSLNLLDREFDNKIYPTLTEVFGSEWKPGIDKNSHITVLIHPMKEEAGGYFNPGD